MERAARRRRGVAMVALAVGVGTASADDLRFVPDPGVRVEQASNPEAGVDLTGLVSLYYEDQAAQGPGERARVALSVDGLDFQPGSVPTDRANDPRRVRMPDGAWRLYQLTREATLTSSYSVEGLQFTEEPGLRYTSAPEDRGEMGIYELFADSAGGVVMLYLGDLHGLNNTRRAYSTDGGLSFRYERGDVLGDAALGGGGRSYVDITTNALPDGRRRLFAMQGGQGIYSFVTADEGVTFVQEPGPRVSKADWTEFQVVGLFDPTVVRLPDGRYRMYVCGQIDEPGGRSRAVILSATTTR